eukprot:GFUD01000379.1.p1 GENE.GFUD01000379.1~~GFUD01000379.1.p1  ORF type:complete len:183 (-),score=49.43 GFUD01000379.1:64-612(-)
MAGLWRAYTKFVDKFPWGSQILQTGVLCASGDVIAQVVVERKKLEDFEMARVGRFFIMGSCVVAPCIRSWYLVLEKIVKFQGTKAAISKMALDQAFFAPCFLVVFVTAASALQGLSFKDIKKNLDANYVDIVLTNWKIWPATQMMNFYFVPFQHRILVVNIVALFWNTYLASKTNVDSKSEE